MAERRRGWGGWIIGLIVVLILAWVGYWYAAHYAAETALARFTGGGRPVTCAATDVSGFPLRLDIRCDAPTYTTGPAVNASIGNIRATAPLYAPGTVTADIDGPLLVNAPGHDIGLTVTWTSATTSTSAGLGGLTGAGATFTTFKAENTGPLPKLGLVSASAESASGAFAPADGGSYRITGDARGLTLTGATSALPTIDVSVDATAENVGSLGFHPEPVVLTWLRGTPSVTINDARLAMAGAIVGASGKLSLSKDGKLNGTLLLRYSSIDALGNLLETLKPGSRDKYSAALQGLAAMSKAVDTPDGPALETTVSFLDGLVFLTILPLPIDPIPPIHF